MARKKTTTEKIDTCIKAINIIKWKILQSYSEFRRYIIDEEQAYVRRNELNQQITNWELKIKELQEELTTDVLFI